MENKIALNQSLTHQTCKPKCPGINPIFPYFSTNKRPAKLGDNYASKFYGAFFGWLAVFLIFIVASVSGAVVGSAAKLWNGDAGGATGWEGVKARWMSSSSILPFGPFLAAGAVAYLFFEPWIYRAGCKRQH